MFLRPFFVLASLSMLVELSFAQEDGRRCYSNVSDPYLYFSTKTSYFVTDNEDDDPAESPEGTAHGAAKKKAKMLQFAVISLYNYFTKDVKQSLSG